MRRVVVTGLGVLAPNGVGTDAFWDGLIHPAMETRPAMALPSSEIRVAEIRDNSWIDELPVNPAALDRSAQLAVSAAGEALKSAGLVEGSFDPLRAGVIIGNGAGGQVTMDQQFRRLYEEKKRRTHPLTIAKSMVSSSASWVSMAYGLKGPTFVVGSACASGTHAIGIALGLIRGGMADVILAGGAEAPLADGTIVAWESMRILSPDSCRPFSLDRRGLILGEGAATLVLESEAHAKARGANILAYLDGFGCSADAGDIVMPDRTGMSRAMSLCLADASLSPAEISYVNAHGTGTQSNDKTEAEAVIEIFGSENCPPISSIKAVTGHGLGAAGAIEAVASVLALRHKTIPPTANHTGDDPDCPVDCVPNTARTADLASVMSNSFAFGGLNASLVFMAG